MWHPPVTVFLAGNMFSQNVALRHEKVKIRLPQSFLVNQKWSLKEALVVTGDILRKYVGQSSVANSQSHTKPY